MNSISTNPFDDDENADSITLASTMEYSPGQRLHKKKRRAPQPPTPTAVSILILIDPSIQHSMFSCSYLLTILKPAKGTSKGIFNKYLSKLSQ